MRVTLFLLALAVLLATATPTAWGHEGHDHDDRATRAELVELIESDPLIQARQVDAHMIRELHEAHGHELWARGRGDWGHSWAIMRVEARQFRSYLLSKSESVRRFALVMHWRKVADCESTGNWSINTGNGFYGGLQFTMGTWAAYGGEGSPQHQPAWYQAQIADNVRTESGLQHWPVCGQYYR